MRASWWSQRLDYHGTFALPAAEAHDRLLRYYESSSGSFKLDECDPPDSFSFQRGSTLFSVLGLGSELSAKHVVTLEFERVSDSACNVIWHIDVKLFGVQVGRNAIVAECETLAKELA